ncbi:hypothetical protein [Frankia sp. AgW1.1]|uniref:hypothetical protein n=1 Tax=Frankia sp. AgW1.1 TaxID=1836971 RepID=UPI0019347A73|nr:hypothetical protein [Frankia sp. AgW1.1]MBL7494380.1 hypothetical protein [Frankia sp. AgW1.1]
MTDDEYADYVLGQVRMLARRDDNEGYGLSLDPRGARAILSRLADRGPVVPHETFVDDLDELRRRAEQ